MTTSASTPSRAKTRLYACAYVGLATADTYLAAKGSRRARFLTKPLLMPTLAAAFSSATQTTSAASEPTTRRVLAAQGLSWGGDVALLGQSQPAFLTGLSSFFGGHVAYLAAFATTKSAGLPALSPTTRKVTVAALAGGPLMAAAASRKDPHLRGPVAAYTSVLTAMFVGAASMDHSLPHQARRWASAGGTLFVLSDSLIGLREFVLPGKSALLDGAVMATYTAGQGLIAAGMASALNELP